MTDKPNWCPRCKGGYHKECSGHFWRGGKKVPCVCPHPRPGVSAGERAREFQALRLQRLAQMERENIDRRVEIVAQIGVPPELLQNNRKVIRLQ
jgi:hypothetical protein